MKRSGQSARDNGSQATRTGDVYARDVALGCPIVQVVGSDGTKRLFHAIKTKCLPHYF
jgi:hypothetical protein